MWYIFTPNSCRWNPILFALISYPTVGDEYLQEVGSHGTTAKFEGWSQEWRGSMKPEHQPCHPNLLGAPCYVCHLCDFLPTVPSNTAICEKHEEQHFFCQLKIIIEVSVSSSTLPSWFLFPQFVQIVICTWGTACAFFCDHQVKTRRNE